MKATRRWKDAGSNYVPSDEVKLSSSGASIQNGKSVVTVSLERESQDAARKDRYDTQRMALYMTPEEAKQLAVRLLNSCIALEFYAANNRWPNIQDLDKVKHYKPEDF